jgi:hypothetical protein
MRRALSDTESYLMAYVIQKHDLREVPHSAFHSLEATHMKTILSQLNDNTWYKTFTTLNTFENQSLQRLLHPWVNGKIYDREMVVLKVLHANKLNAWMFLLTELLRNQRMGGDGRILLAIVREKLVDGKPLSQHRMPPPGWPTGPPPPMPRVIAPPVPHVANYGLPRISVSFCLSVSQSSRRNI